MTSWSCNQHLNAIKLQLMSNKSYISYHLTFFNYMWTHADPENILIRDILYPLWRPAQKYQNNLINNILLVFVASSSIAGLSNISAFQIARTDRGLSAANKLLCDDFKSRRFALRPNNLLTLAVLFLPPLLPHAAAAANNNTLITNESHTAGEDFRWWLLNYELLSNRCTMRLDL